MNVLMIQKIMLKVFAFVRIESIIAMLLILMCLIVAKDIQIKRKALKYAILVAAGYALVYMITKKIM